MRCRALGFELPAQGDYAVGAVFLPQDPTSRQHCVRRLEAIAADEGQPVLGWRDVPTENATLGATARASQPAIRQVFLRRGEATPAGDAFERKLYVIRRLVEKSVSRSAMPGRGDFYVSSLSARTLVYKGMLNADQLRDFYPDLRDEALRSALAMVHSRFSTNTFPSWSRAHPYRYISHNGEINTLRGNVNWVKARQRMFASRLFGDDLKKVLPVIDTEGSDSSMFDNVLELLTLSGRVAAARHDDDGAGAVEPARVDERRSARTSTSSTAVSWSRGTGRPPSRSPTASASARSSTATACAPPDSS